jgi:hypothetical protein
MAEAGGEQGRYRVTEDVPQRYYDIEHTRMTLEAGYLGKIFGSAANAPIYIAGIVIFLFSIICIIVLFVETRVPAADFLQVAIPLISLALGYLFGFGKST